MELSALYTDLYQLSMGQVFFLNNNHRQHAVFDYFFRKLPFNGGYVVFAGLEDLLEKLEGLKFTPADIDYLNAAGFDRNFTRYLSDFRFSGNIYSIPEGEILFPNEPAMRFEGELLEIQLIETLVLNLLNFQSLVATKAARIRQVAGDRILADFGLRRAQGFGGYHASRAAVIGGFQSTSNVRAAADFSIPATGTMAHSFIQHFGDELQAFRYFAGNRPHKCILLVDTYDTLKSGLPNAITVAKEMESRGERLEAIRLDSGDLAYLAQQARHLLDEAGLHYVKIAASNQLDEYVIKSLLEQDAPIDIFGVGTSLVTGEPDAALDGVYKLSHSNGRPAIKLSESLSKTTLPDRKQVLRAFTEAGHLAGADVVILHDEGKPEVMHHPFEPDVSLSLGGMHLTPLLSPVMEQGKRLHLSRTPQEIGQTVAGRLSLLPREYKRFENPHTYKVGISTKLRDLRDNLRRQYKK